jgi:hypothetical protein
LWHHGKIATPMSDLGHKRTSHHDSAMSVYLAVSTGRRSRAVVILTHHGFPLSACHIASHPPLRCASVWKTVNNVTSGAFVKMWQERVSQFYSQYSETIAK